MQKKFIKRNKKFYNGFTLVELLIAVSILSLSILATFTAISNNLRGSNFTEDQVTAYYLADEGLEFIRNMRDHNGLANAYAKNSGGSVPWFTGISQISTDPCYNKICTVDSPLATIASCSGGASTCLYLRRDSSSGLYGYTSSWTLTQFQRSVAINIISATEANVSVTVSWVTGGIPASYTLSEILRDWQ